MAYSAAQENGRNSWVVPASLGVAFITCIALAVKMAELTGGVDIGSLSNEDAGSTTSESPEQEVGCTRCGQIVVPGKTLCADCIREFEKDITWASPR